MSSPASIMFVHGAWHGSWCWDPVRDVLRDQGVATYAVDNPSVTRPGSDLAADADNLRAELSAIDGAVVLVGHSYGGAVISEAGVHPNVQQLVYLTAFALDAGESLAANELQGTEEMTLFEAVLFDEGVMTIDPARAVDLFFHDCTPSVADEAAARLQPMSLAATGTPLRSAAWREKPSAYIACTEDRALPLALQRSCAARVGDVVEMPTSHSPFLSRPTDLARILAAYVS